MTIKVGIADDQQLFLKSLATLINTFSDFEVLIEGHHGEDLLRKLRACPVRPDILLVDVNMPVLDGPATVKQVTAEFPQVKTVALSMKADDTSILQMLQAGCCAYLLKDLHPQELQKALQEVQTKGFYNADAINVNYRRLILRANEGDLGLSAREKDFLQLACSDLTYKEIAGRMCVSEKTVDGYRESLFRKLQVKSRVGMALEAMRRGLVTL